MEAVFREFGNLLESHKIDMEEKYMFETLNNFDFFLAETNMKIYENMFQDSNKSKVIIIDEFQEKNGSKYTCLCFNYQLLIINQNNASYQSFLTNFLSFQEKSEIYFLNSSIKQGSLSEEERIFNNEIHKFSQILNIKNKQLLDFWPKIVNCLSAFLIKKAYREINKKSFNKEYPDIHDNQEIIDSSANHFIQMREIGRGSTAIVYLVYHVEKEKLFALKMPFDNTSYLNDRERSNLVKMKYPFIPKYYGYVEIEGIKCILLDFINGKTLKNYDLKNLNEIERYDIIFEIMLTIHYIHSKSLIIRDLNLNNIIINKNKDAYLIDFDRVIKMENQNTFDFCLIDLPELDNNKKFTPKSDIYLLGFIICYILNGGTPKKKQKFGINNNDIIYDLSFLPPDSLIKSIVESCCQIDPDNRPLIRDIISKYFDAYLSKIQNKTYKEESIIKLYLNMENNDYENLESLSIRVVFYDENFVNNNFEKAFNLYSQEAAKNNPRALYALGKIYEKGKHVKRDINKMINYYTKAAKQNYKRAQFELGLIYSNGRYVSQDIRKAIYFYSLAAEPNSSPPLINFGVIHENDDEITSYSQINLGYIYKDMHDIPKAFKYFKLAADKNIPNAQYGLGQLYLEGEYVGRNIKLAIKYFELAANQNYDLAQISLGRLYVRGEYVERDFKKSIFYYTLAANQNNLEAQFELAEIYFNEYVKPDVSKMIYYYTQVADQENSQSGNNLYNGNIQNSTKAKFMLGLIYLKGKFVSCDIRKAIHFFTLAANENCSDAQYELGKIYEIGKYVEHNVQTAIHYYTLAANQYNQCALYQLGCIYYTSFDVPRDINKAIYYFELCSTIYDDSDAQYSLGFIYSEKNLYCFDIKKAIYYLMLSADKNNASAQFLLGSLYEVGEFVERDLKKAFFYFNLAASNNDSNAINNIGTFYGQGKYVQFDIRKAIHYYTLAANKNNSLSQMNLGKIYINERFTTFNLKKGIYYLSLAAKQNQPSAKYFLGCIYHQGSYIDTNIELAIKYFKDASNLNHPYAKNNLGVIYKTGYGVKRDLWRSNEYFKEAIRYDNDNIAKFNLAHTYFYEEEYFNIERAIELLIFICNDNQFAFRLLCLATIKKYNNLNQSEIIKDFKNLDEKKGELLAKNIITTIIKFNLKKQSNYEELYFYIKKINLIYNKLKVEIQTISKKYPIIDKRKPINSYFYEGLGDVI